MSHHRGHTINFMQEAMSELALAQTRFATYLKTADTPETTRHQLHRRWSAYYMAHTAQAIIETMIELRKDKEQLEVARRILNQPQNDEPRSSVREVQRAAGHMSQLQYIARDEPTKHHDALMLASATEHVTLAWVGLDRAIWHINDAIREEVYEDPNFGP